MNKIEIIKEEFDMNEDELSQIAAQRYKYPNGKPKVVTNFAQKLVEDIIRESER